jgi:hypothetical protein
MFQDVILFFDVLTQENTNNIRCESNNKHANDEEEDAPTAENQI